MTKTTIYSPNKTIPGTPRNTIFEKETQNKCKIINSFCLKIKIFLVILQAKPDYVPETGTAI